MFDGSPLTNTAFSNLTFLILILQIRKTGSENISNLPRDKLLIGSGTGTQISISLAQLATVGHKRDLRTRHLGGWVQKP